MMLGSGAVFLCAAVFLFLVSKADAQQTISDSPIQLVPAFPTEETQVESVDPSPQAPSDVSAQNIEQDSAENSLPEDSARNPNEINETTQDNVAEAIVDEQSDDLSLEAETLTPLDPAGTGPLSQGNGGLPVDMWRGASLDRIESLLGYLPDRQDSRVLEELTRRFLLSQARLPVPASRNPQNTDIQNTDDQNTAATMQRQAIVGLRLDRLAALGYGDTAADFWRSINRKISVPATPLIERLFETGAFAQACTLFSETQSQPIDVFDPQAIVFDTACKIQSGRLAEAALNIELIREFPDSDPVFLDLAWRAAHPDFTLDTPPPSPTAPVHYALAAHLDLLADLAKDYTESSPLDPQAVQRAMRSFMASLGSEDIPDQAETWPLQILLDPSENALIQSAGPARVYDILYQLPLELYRSEFPVDLGWESLPNGAHHQRSGLESSATLRGLIERAMDSERWGEAVAGYLIGARERDVADLSAEEIGLGARVLVAVGLHDLARLFALDALEAALFPPPPVIADEPDTTQPDPTEPDTADPFADVSSLLTSDGSENFPEEEDQLE